PHAPASSVSSARSLHDALPISRSIGDENTVFHLLKLILINNITFRFWSMKTYKIFITKKRLQILSGADFKMNRLSVHEIQSQSFGSRCSGEDLNVHAQCNSHFGNFFTDASKSDNSQVFTLKFYSFGI